MTSLPSTPMPVQPTLLLTHGQGLGADPLEVNHRAEATMLRAAAQPQRHRISSGDDEDEGSLSSHGAHEGSEEEEEGGEAEMEGEEEEEEEEREVDPEQAP